MTEIEIPKPDVSSAIKMFAKNNYAGTLTGEAFKDLFDLIESQKEALFKADDDHAKFVDDAHDTVKTLERQNQSQKEEIEKVKKERNFLMSEEYLAIVNNEIDRQSAEIISLKAITELAVKSLEKVRDRYAGEYGGHICETEMREIANSTLSEIERLQNAQT